MRKTSKAVLSQTLEKLSAPEESLPANIVTIVQKINGNLRTFEDIAKSVFNRILHEAVGSKRVDVIFDVYRDISIKNIERAEKRDSYVAPKFRNILPKHEVQQWQQFLKGNENSPLFDIPFLKSEGKLFM